MRVLVVDDEVDLLEVTSSWLSSKGRFAVEGATSAKEGLALLHGSRFDAVVSDYQMPGMNGVDFLKEVRSSGMKVPFIIFTGKGRESVVIEALNSGADGYLQKGGEPRSLFAELAHRIEVVVARNRAEESIKESEKRLADIIEFFPDAVLSIDLEGRTIIWNRAIERMSGVPATEMLGKADMEYSLPFYGERRPQLMDIALGRHSDYKRRYQNVEVEGESITAEAFCPALNRGKGGWVFAKATPLRDREGRVIGAIESIRDVSDRMQMTEAMQEANVALSRQSMALNVLNQVVKAANRADGLQDLFASVMNEILTTLDFDGGGIYLVDQGTGTAHLAFAKGLPSEFISQVGKVSIAAAPHSKLFIDGESIISDRYDEIAPASAATGNIMSLASVPLISKGSVIGALNVGTHKRMIISQEEMAMLISIGQEVGSSVERMASDEKLKIVVQDMDALFNSITEMLFVLDREGNILDVNSTVVQKLHFSREELVGMNVLVLHVPERRDEALRIVRGMMAGAIDTCPVPVMTKEGGRIDVETRVTKGHWNGHEVMIGVTRDVSERKRMEAELRRSEALFRALFERGATVMLIIDMNDGRILDANRAAAAFYGWTVEELRGLSISDISTHSKEEISMRMSSIAANHLMHREFRHRTSDGSIRDVEVFANKVDAEQGPFIYSIIQDITERKRVEVALRASEERYHSIFSESPIAIELYDDAGRLIRANDSCLRLFGVTDEKLISGFNLFDDPNLSADSKQQLRDGATIRYEIAFDFEAVKRHGIYPTTKSGIIWLDALISPLAAPSGGYLAQVVDITDRKMAEDALRRSEEKFREIFNNINDGITIHMPAENGMPGMMIECNDIACQMLGYSREEMMRLSPLEFIAGPHDPPMEAIIEGLVRTGISKFQTVHRRKDGSTFPVEISAHAYQFGGTRLYLAAVRDISSRKAAEAELLRSKKELADIIEFLPDATMVIDAHGRTLAWNHAMEVLTGVGKSDVMEGGGKVYSVPFYGEHREMLVDMLDRPDEEVRGRCPGMTRMGDALSLEAFASNLDHGRGRYVSITARPLHDQDGKRIGAVQSIRDITESILAQQEIAFQMAELYNASEALMKVTRQLRASEAALKKAGNQLNILNSITRHDVLNQVMIISASSDILAKTELGPKQTELNAKIGRSARTIRHQMEFAKMYQNIGVEAPAWHDLRECVRRAGESLDTGDLEIVSSSLDYEVLADPMFEKFIYNMIDNTLRHGGGAKHLSFDAEETDGSLVLVVEDDGCGISEEDREHLFERGYGKNTGFGLFLTREILAITGITIDERSGPGQGARFVVAIPAGDWRAA